MRLNALVLLASTGIPLFSQQPAGTSSAACLDGAQLTQLIQVVNMLRAEVQEIKAELAMARLNAQRAMVSQLNAELDRVALEKQQLGAHEEARLQEREELHDRLRNTDLKEEDRTQAEEALRELGSTRLRELQDDSDSLAAREREILKRVELERSRLEAMEAAAGTGSPARPAGQ